MKLIDNGGHGFNTSGKRTPDGSMREWEFNHAVAEKVAIKMSKYVDLSWQYTHDPTGKVDVPLTTRVSQATSWSADLYLSIHANAHGDGWNDANGIETYVHPKASKKSREVAASLQKHLIAETGRKNRGVKEANFQELRAPMPAVLIECGFMTNKEEAALLKSDAYREKCAVAIEKALVESYKLVKKPTPASVQKPVVPKPATDSNYTVQVGNFGNKDNAIKLEKELEAKGIDAFIKEVKK